MLCAHCPSQNEQYEKRHEPHNLLKMYIYLLVYGIVLVGQRTSEQQEIRLRAVDSIVDPAVALLDSKSSPLLLAQ